MGKLFSDNIYMNRFFFFVGVCVGGVDVGLFCFVLFFGVFFLRSDMSSGASVD